jgi:hypothetical protein
MIFECFTKVMGEGGMCFPHGGVRLGRGTQARIGNGVWGLGNSEVKV